MMRNGSTRAKSIVICSDGTGNTAVKGRGTNVFKLFEAVDVEGHKRNPRLRPQVAFYDDGVGSEDFKLMKVLGGAFGYGLSRNIRGLYAELARVYEAGDRIFVFGFSRGAYTVRTLVGLITACGILDRRNCRNESELKRKVALAYQAYRLKYESAWNKVNRRRRNVTTPVEFRQEWSVRENNDDGNTRIAFVGVWDTVAAVGLPFAELKNPLQWFYRFEFCDHKLHPHVLRACHALAIDDERKAFHPVLWDEREEMDQTRIQQVWFAGAHSDVGGGYPRHGLSITALNWMMEQAEACGLRFIRAERIDYRRRVNPHDKAHDPRAGLGVYYRYLPRNMHDMCNRCGVSAKVHVSTLERIARGTQAYAPPRFAADNIVGLTHALQPKAIAIRNAVNKMSQGSSQVAINRIINSGARIHYYFLLSNGASAAASFTVGWWFSSWACGIGAFITAFAMLCIIFGMLARRRLKELRHLASEGWMRERETIRELLLLP